MSESRFWETFWLCSRTTLVINRYKAYLLRISIKAAADSYLRTSGFKRDFINELC
jgi:hypothetical protein